MDELKQYFLDVGLEVVHEDIVPSGDTRWISASGRNSVVRLAFLFVFAITLVVLRGGAYGVYPRYAEA